MHALEWGATELRQRQQPARHQLRRQPRRRRSYLATNNREHYLVIAVLCLIAILVITAAVLGFTVGVSVSK